MKKHNPVVKLVKMCATLIQRNAITAFHEIANAKATLELELFFDEKFRRYCTDAFFGDQCSIDVLWTTFCDF